jgi:isopenicillin N synthase-like dioxygenase
MSNETSRMSADAVLPVDAVPPVDDVLPVIAVLPADAVLPVIDIGAFEHGGHEAAHIREAVRRALTESGFMTIQGHGIDSALVSQAFAAAQGFFDRPRADKDVFGYATVDENFGFQGIEAESLDPAAMPDLKEAFTMRNALAAAMQPARWPDAQFRATAMAFYEAALSAAYRIMRILAACLELPAEFFTERHRGENVTLRFLHYPANLPVKSSAQLGAGAHTDYGSITLLFQDDVGGLELRDADGEWRLAPPVPQAVLINTGDLMERWTNGRFPSTVHRVRPISGTRDRFSIALFVDPDAAVEIDCIASCTNAEQPARYPRVTAGEHIRQKIAATHGRDGRGRKSA